jgi:beta-lactam-binding protein with PASTA domain
VVTQSLSAGSKAVPGAEVQLAIAIAPSTSTAPPIDPGMELTGTPTPMPPCQAVGGTPAPPGNNVTVPNLVGMTALQALQAAEAAGFSISMEVANPPAGEHVQPGTVFAQTPSAGTTARSRSGVILYVAPVSQ